VLREVLVVAEHHRAALAVGQLLKLDPEGIRLDEVASFDRHLPMSNGLAL
jgi:hypothetical protein